MIDMNKNSMTTGAKFVSLMLLAALALGVPPAFLIILSLPDKKPPLPLRCKFYQLVVRIQTINTIKI